AQHTPTCCSPYSSCLCKLRPAQGSTLFPYTTLFRSAGCDRRRRRHPLPRPARALRRRARAGLLLHLGADRGRRARAGRGSGWRRSEEHTSELQSRENLVCRLLLEKKSIIIAAIVIYI